MAGAWGAMTPGAGPLPLVLLFLGALPLLGRRLWFTGCPGISMVHRRRDDEQCPPRAVNLSRSDRSHLHQHMICRGGPRNRRRGLRDTCHLTSVHRHVVLQALIAAWSLPGEGEGLGIVVGQAQIRHRRGHRTGTGRRTGRPCRCTHRGGGRHGVLRWGSGVLTQGDDGCDHPEEGDPSRRSGNGS